MSQLTFLNSLESDKKVHFGEILYSKPSFLKQFQRSTFHYYAVSEEGYAVMHVAFTISEKKAYSLHQLPFGGIETSTSISEDEVISFIDFFETELQVMGVNEIRLHQSPKAYGGSENIEFALIERGYTSFQERIYHGIDIADEDLLERMHNMEQRKYKLCLKDGAEFKLLKKNDAVKAYQWIERNRDLGQKPTSMSWLDLRDVSLRNPKVYKAFGVFMDGYMLAATVVVMVNDKVAYHFLPASQVEFQHYRKYSPMVFLVNELYKWCREQGIRHLDLGSSYVDSKLKSSLVNFKENIGGKPTLAMSWKKQI